MNTDDILLTQFIERQPAQASQAFERMNRKELSGLIDSLPLELNLKLFNLLNPFKLAKCLPLIKPTLAQELVEQGQIQLTETLLRQTDSTYRNELLKKISPKRSAILTTKLKYAADTVGAFMNPAIVSLNKEVTVRETIEILNGDNESPTASIYIIDNVRKLEGVIGVHQLVYADQDSPLSSIMEIDVPKFFADTPIESILNHTGWFRHRAIPVVDQFGSLLGAISLASIQQNNRANKRDTSKHLADTGQALGELYLIGIKGLLESVTK